MRVLHVTRSLDPNDGGPIAALIGLATAQAAEGLDVAIAATWRAQRELETAERLRASGAPVHLAGPARGPLRSHATLDRMVAAAVDEADVVHIHMLWEQIQHVAAHHAARTKVPCIWRPCGMLDPWSLRQSRLKKMLYMAWRLRRDLRRARALHFASAIEAQAGAQLGLNVPAIVEPNGVDLAEFDPLPQRGAFRARYPQLDSRPYVAFLGRLYPGKGVEMLIPAFARLQNTRAMLVLIGPDQDGYRAQCEAMVREHALSDRVVFTGMLCGRDKVAALADADLFALPSAHENFGVAVVEALAAGLPVVISDQVYLHPEITAAQVGGVVPMDVDALARELDRWLDDDALRRSAAERARPFVWQRYDWRQIAYRWRGHYERITGSGT